MQRSEIWDYITKQLLIVLILPISRVATRATHSVCVVKYGAHVSVVAHMQRSGIRGKHHHHQKIIKNHLPNTTKNAKN